MTTNDNEITVAIQTNVQRNLSSIDPNNRFDGISESYDFTGMSIGIVYGYPDDAKHLHIDIYSDVLVAKDPEKVFCMDVVRIDHISDLLWHVQASCLVAYAVVQHLYARVATEPF